MKTEYKQFWDVDLGVSYIPWEKVKLDDLEGFAEGGMIDQETVNTGTNINNSDRQCVYFGNCKFSEKLFFRKYIVFFHLLRFF